MRPPKSLRNFPPSLFWPETLIADPARLPGGNRSDAIGTSGLYRSLQARRALRSTLVHGPNYFLPAQAAAGVITVHDLSVFHYRRNASVCPSTRFLNGCSPHR